MAHHAYFYAGDRKEGSSAARAFAGDVEDVALFEYDFFSVDDARRIIQFAQQAPSKGDQKVVVLSAGRLFHEAQNALLKLFEEPVEGTILILIVPAEGVLLPTLRSRLIALPKGGVENKEELPFLLAGQDEREKMVAKLVAKTKSDKDDEKQAARLEAIELLGSITKAVHRAKEKTRIDEYDQLLSELDRFAPLLHERSPAIKLIFEHLLLVLPRTLPK